ncbi:MAG: hypothetical protein ACD_20C00388G0002 [uncultured bacterium]|nr:MAG: hypothetical protein ACD_20C00388G0002 [uncultured bacterium]
MRKTILCLLIVIVLIFSFWQVFLRDIEITGKANLSWNAAPESDVVKYRIYYGTEKRSGNCPQGGYAKKIDAGSKTSYQLNDLKDGETYYFSVTSINSAGKESCFSEEMSKRIKLSFIDKFKSLFY